MSKPNWSSTGRPDGAGHLDWSAMAEGAIDDLIDEVAPLGLPPDNPNAVAREGSGASAVVRRDPSVTVTRDAQGRVASMIEQGVTTSVSRDPSGRYSALTVGGVGFAISRDASGRVVSVQEV